MSSDLPPPVALLTVREQVGLFRGDYETPRPLAANSPAAPVGAWSVWRRRAA